MRKNFLRVSIFLLALFMVVLVLASCWQHQGTIDTTKTQLYIYNYDGGIGTEWLERLKAKFEEQYKEESFEPEKKGVEIIIKRDKGNPSSTIAEDYNEIFFAEGINYNDLIVQGRLLDISDIVNETLPGESKSIADKLTAEKISAFTVLDGKHYVLPHYEIYSGVTYDVDLFEEKRLYFGTDGGYTNYAQSYNENPELSLLSAGPDGIKGTYDDGLPATYEQFIKLCSDMKKMHGITPFVFTGSYPKYINHLMGALWAKYNGAKEFMYNVSFDSGSDTTRVIVDFNNDEPVISNLPVTPENGYITTWQAGKYYALNFIEKIVKNTWYDLDSARGTTSHMDAQTNYVFSRLENKPIAMIIEGSYWYNEAENSIKRSERTYPKAINRKLAWMPLPGVISGQVDETNGVKNTVYDTLSSFAFINANIKDNPNKVRLAKLFLQFCYKDENLQDFTLTTGVPKGVDYELTAEQYNSLNYYYKSIYDIKQNSDVVFPYSNSNIFVKHTADFLLQGPVFQSTINNKTYTNLYSALMDTTANNNAKQYFNGMKITESQWNKYLN
jgi:hypothetical protein